MVWMSIFQPSLKVNITFWYTGKQEAFCCQGGDYRVKRAWGQRMFGRDTGTLRKTDNAWKHLL